MGWVLTDTARDAFGNSRGIPVIMMINDHDQSTGNESNWD
jgi:hypothetical protein